MSLEKDVNIVRGYQLHNGDVFTVTSKCSVSYTHLTLPTIRLV